MRPDRGVALRVRARIAPIVLVHGLAGSTRWWSANLAPLAERHDVRVLDLPGFGALRGRRFALGEAPAFVREWLAAERLERVHLVGHSLGGVVSARVAARWPDAVDRLVLVSPAGALAERSLHRYLVPLALAARSARPSFLRVLAEDSLRAGPLTLLRAGRELLADEGLREELGAIRAPTLLVWGELDPLVPPSVAEAFTAEIPDARLLVLPGVGHVPMVERPDEFNRALLDFLG